MNVRKAWIKKSKEATSNKRIVVIITLIKITTCFFFIFMIKHWPHLLNFLDLIMGTSIKKFFHRKWYFCIALNTWSTLIFQPSNLDLMVYISFDFCIHLYYRSKIFKPRNLTYDISGGARKKILGWATKINY